MSDHFSRYDRKKKTHSVYCYEGTEVLINKENIRNVEELAKYEADITMIRQYQLENENPVRGKFGVAHLKKIHQAFAYFTNVRLNCTLSSRQHKKIK